MSDLENVKKLRLKQGLNLRDAVQKIGNLPPLEKREQVPLLQELPLPLQKTLKLDGQTTEGLLPQITKKPWGHERIIAKTDCYVVKEIFVKARHRLSEQYHKKKTETMFLVSGNAWLELAGVGFNLAKLTPVFIPPKTIHRLAAIGDCVIIEISSTQLDDVVRLDDDYNRKE